jgi:hypothetical protein
LRDRLWGGFDISAYGGIPVETDFDTRSVILSGGGSARVARLVWIGLSICMKKTTA